MQTKRTYSVCILIDRFASAERVPTARTHFYLMSRLSQVYSYVCLVIFLSSIPEIEIKMQWQTVRLEEATNSLRIGIEFAFTTWTFWMTNSTNDLHLHRQRAKKTYCEYVVFLLASLVCHYTFVKYYMKLILHTKIVYLICWSII